MKNKISLKGAALAAIAALALLGVIGCKQPQLEAGGAYTYVYTNTVGTNVTTGTEKDMGLFVADATFKVVYDTLDNVFNIEFKNRDFFWKLSPAVKHSLDKVRAQAGEVKDDYLTARQAYIAHPSPGGLTGLNEILAKAQQLEFAAQAILGNYSTNGVFNVSTNH